MSKIMRALYAEAAAEKWVVIPVVANFDLTNPIGELRIKASVLPSTPDFVFSIGYTVKDGSFVDDKIVVRDYELMCVSLLSDENYIGHLRQEGKIR